DPIDYLTSGLAVTNCALTVASGTAIGCYNETGIWLQEGSTFTSIGTPLSPNWFVRYQSAQEQPTPLGVSPPDLGFSVNPYHTGSPVPTGLFRFSRFTCPANGGIHFYDRNWSYGNLLLQDSEVWGGANIFGGASHTVATLKNNLFYRGSFSASSALTNSLSLSNNLFWSVTGLAISPADSSLWSVYDNLFDSCTLVRFPGTVDASGYNAYYHWNNHSRPSATRRRHPPERMDITQPGVLRSEQSWDEQSTARDPDSIASVPQDTP